MVNKFNKPLFSNILILIKDIIKYANGLNNIKLFIALENKYLIPSIDKIFCVVIKYVSNVPFAPIIVC